MSMEVVCCRRSGGVSSRTLLAPGGGDGLRRRRHSPRGGRRWCSGLLIPSAPFLDRLLGVCYFHVCVFHSHLESYDLLLFICGAVGPGTETSWFWVPRSDTYMRGRGLPRLHIFLLFVRRDRLPLDRKDKKHHKPTLNRNNISK